MAYRVCTERFTIKTGRKTELVNLTSKVLDLVCKSAIRDGSALVYTPHTTSAIRVNEDEEFLKKDFEKFLEELVPPDKSCYHDEMIDKGERDCPPDERKNGPSHLRALLMGASETIPISDYKLALGRWQSVYFVELDGPRKRAVIVQVSGEG